MRAFKCDRCGGYYDTVSKAAEVYRIFRKPAKCVDLCEPCLADLVRWMDAYKEGGEQDGNHADSNDSGNKDF